MQLQDEIGRSLQETFGAQQIRTYAASGRCDTGINPGLHIDGIGGIGLPLPNRDAQTIIAAAEQAPFGHRNETKVDLNVQNTHQIDAAKVTCANPAWSAVFEKDILEPACAELGVPSQNVEAHFYKLLIYSPGGKFEKRQERIWATPAPLPSPTL